MSPIYTKELHRGHRRPAHWKLIINTIVILLTWNSFGTSVLGFNSSGSALQSDGYTSIGRDLQTGPVIQTQDSFTDISTPIVRTEPPQKQRVSNLATGLLKRVRLQTTVKPIDSLGRNEDKKHEELSTDCLAKRQDILQKKQSPAAAASKPPNTSPIISGYQKLKPKHDNSTSPRNFVNESFIGGNAFDNEHVPQCTRDGRYEPTQCHKIGYCWCVNKFGQAIKNSASLAGERPNCDINKYESESNDLLVVTGISANRIKGLLKPVGSSPESENSNAGVTPSSDSDPEAGTSDHDDKLTARERSGDSNRRSSSTSDQSAVHLALLPNECTLSRENAKERASKHADDSIWIPDCDSANGKLYAEKQCHKARVCWCVDQVTGLPLRTSEKLTMQNCTEIKRIIASAFIRQTSSRSQSSFVYGSSESCESDKRVQFVLFLIGQFKQQLSEYTKINPTSSPPEGLTSLNPYRLTESQVSRWKFYTMDSDFDGKLNDREWSKFKQHFKLFEKAEDIPKFYKQQPTTHSLTPLSILRDQRRCWRDFLQYCANGDILTNQSIGLGKWLSCTELPVKTNQSYDKNKNGQLGLDSIAESTYAYTKAAAIARSKKPNPFLGILKPN